MFALFTGDVADNLVLTERRRNEATYSRSATQNFTVQ